MNKDDVSKLRSLVAKLAKGLEENSRVHRAVDQGCCVNGCEDKHESDCEVGILIAEAKSLLRETR